MSGPRFSIIPAGAVTDERLDPRDLQVLCLLGKHTDDNGWCSRSQVKMAREMRCGRSTVQRSITRLVEVGYVQHWPVQRPDGGDCAHHYRVLLDRPEAPTEAPDPEPDLLAGDTDPAPNPVADPGPDGAGGVPTHGQGVPSQDGQGVPSHGRAPIRTTPDNDPLKNERERERASAGPKTRKSDRRDEPGPTGPGSTGGGLPDADLFDRFTKRWPTFAADSRPRTESAWSRLSTHERQEADRSVEAFLEHLRKLKRSTTPAAFTYLAERRWEALPIDKRDPPTRAFCRVWSRLWWALLFRLIDRGEPLSAHVESLRHPGMKDAGVFWPVADVPDDMAEAALISIRSDTAEAWAWTRWLEDRGLSMRFDPTRAFWLWLPARWPPGWDEARVNAARASEATQPKISPQTLERMKSLGLGQ